MQFICNVNCLQNVANTTLVWSDEINMQIVNHDFKHEKFILGYSECCSSNEANLNLFSSRPIMKQLSEAQIIWSFWFECHFSNAEQSKMQIEAKNTIFNTFAWFSQDETRINSENCEKFLAVVSFLILAACTSILTAFKA